MSDWDSKFAGLQDSITFAQGVRAEIEKWETEAAATIAKYARSKGAKVNEDAIKASVTRPYTLLPINEHEAWLIHYRGIEMPIFGWVVSQEAAAPAEKEQ